MQHGLMPWAQYTRRHSLLLALAFFQGVEKVQEAIDAVKAVLLEKKGNVNVKVQVRADFDFTAPVERKET